MPRRSLVVLLVAMVAGAALTACGGDDGGGEGRVSERRAARRLVATQWVLDQDASDLSVSSPAAIVTAQFATDGGRSGEVGLSGNAGCNDYFASATIDGSQMTVGDEIMRNLRACDRPLMRVEDAYLTRLPKAESFSVDGSVLTIETSGAGPLVFDALDPDVLFAGDWVVTSYFRPGAITSTINGTTLTAAFDAGEISGDAGCNRYSGPYAVDGTDLTIGPLATTLRACADPAVGQQETEFVAALELTRSYRFDAGTLTLLRADGGIAVTLQRA